MKKLHRIKFRHVLLIIAILAIIVHFVTKDNNKPLEPIELQYSETVRLIKADKVEEIKVFDEDSAAMVKIIIKDDEQPYEVKVPNQTIFLEFVQETIVEKDISTNIITEEEEKSFWSKIGNFIFTLYFTALLILLLRNLFRIGKSSSDLTSSFKNMFNSDMDYIEKMAKSDIRFTDVAGLEEEKKELTEIVDFMKDPEKYTKLGAKIPKGVLLSGTPGTGKTLLAKAVAGEAEVAFLAVSGSEFVEKYVGVGASRIRGLFKEARTNAPCIIFIDEIDAIGQKRSDSSGITEHNQTLEQLLTEMDGFSTRSDVIVLAATNRPDSLDPALVRPGRFDRRIVVNLPDFKGREDILRIHARNKPFMDDVDFETLSYNTVGFSGAELENLLNESALIAARNTHNAISKSDIDEAMMKILVGLKKSGRVISEKERKLTAYHEAGHAIVNKFLPTQYNVKEVCIIPRGGAGGYTLNERTEEKMYTSKAELEERLQSLLGGRAAEQLVLGDISSGASNDIKVATETAREMITVYGMDSDIGPICITGHSEMDYIGRKIFDRVDDKIAEKVKDAEKRATQILTENRKLLDNLAQMLLEKETVSGDELERLVEAYK